MLKKFITAFSFGAFLIAVVVARVIFFPAPLQAAEVTPAPLLMLPAACTLGSECWIVNYVDTEAAPDAARDFRCGTQTYDEHEGTDFAVRDLAAMVAGVSVLAAADGKVLRVRDDSEDIMPDAAAIETMKADKKGCGNGVLIDHGDGWQTIYCHMKKESIIVTPGQSVRTGEMLGQIGHSGIAEFPHLHFSVFHEGKTIDPFTAMETGTACGQSEGAQPLWRPELQINYMPVSLYAAGFTPGTPDFEAIKIEAATAQTLTAAELPALAFWMAGYGLAAGDKVHIEIRDPQGGLWAQRDLVQDKNRARQFYYVGRKLESKTLAPGVYSGHVRIQRGEEVVGQISAAVTVTP